MMEVWKCPNCGRVVERPEGDSGLCSVCSSFVHFAEQDTVPFGEEVFPQEFGKYVLLEKVGTGGSANVYMARDSALDRIVAIKIPLAGVTIGQEERTRFVRESRTFAQLRHPGIVAVFDVGQVNQTPYLATEFVRGINASELIRGRKLSFPDVALFVAQVAQAVEHAHDKDVIHRDIKPSNIMVDVEGNPRLMDFGIAKNHNGEPTITTDGQILGTPAYMSPEQAAGKARSAEPTSDIYGLGAVLYYLLTGKPPFQGNYRSILLQVLSEEPTAPRTIDRSIPKDLETICQKAMSKDPVHRYQSAEDLGEDLRRFLSGQTIIARRTGRLEKTWRWSRRHPALAGLATLVIVLLVVIAVGSTVSAIQYQRLAQQEHDSRMQAEESLARNRQLMVSMNVAQGERELDAGRLTDALPWYLQAQRIDTPQRQGHHRSRLRLLLDHCPRPIQMWRFSDGCSAAAVDPQGEEVLIVGHDGSAQSFDLWTGAPLSERAQHPGTIQRAEHLPHGKGVVTVSYQRDGARHAGEIRLWDPKTAKNLRSPIRHDALIRCLSVASDGKTLAECTGDQVRIWATNQEGTPLQTIHVGCPILALHYHPNGRTLMVGGVDGSISQWDITTGERVGKELYQQGPVNRLALTPDGQTIATVAGNLGQPGSIYLWDVPRWRLLSNDIRLEDSIAAIDFSPDGRRIVTGARDGTAQVWSFQGRPMSPRIELPMPTSHVSFSPDGTQLLTVCGKPMGEAQIQIWEAATGEPLSPPVKVQGSIATAAYTSDQSGAIVATRDGTTWHWSWIVGPQRSALELPEDDTVATDFREGRLLSLSGSGTLRLQTPGGGSQPWRLRSAEVFPTNMALAPEGSRAAIVYGDGGVSLLELRDGATPVTLADVSGIATAEFSSTGKYLALRTRADELIVWDCTVRERCRFKESLSSVSRYIWHPHEDQMLTVQDGQRICRWNVLTGEAIAKWRNETKVQRLAWSVDGKWSAASDSDGVISLWNLESNKPKRTRQLAHTGLVTILAFDPTGRLLATGAMDGSVKLWDVRRGEMLFSPISHRSAIAAIVFSPNSELLATADGNRSVRLWSSENGEAFSPWLTAEGDVVGLHFSSEPQLMAGSRDGRVTSWNLNPSVAKSDLAAMQVRLLSGAVVNELGALLPSSSAQRFEDFQSVREGFPEFQVVTRSMRAAWHRERARRHLKAERLPEALFHYEWCVRIAPEDSAGYVGRGQVHALMRNWAAASADFYQALEGDHPNLETYRSAALTSLVAGKQDRYEAVCRSLFAEFQASEDLEDLMTVARVCTLGANEIANSGQAAELAARLHAKAPEDALSQATYAIALYRCKRWEEARSIAGTVGSQGSTSAHNDLIGRSLPAFRSVLTAMAASGAGDSAGLAALKQNAELATFAMEALQNCPWPVQAELTILQSEVEGLLATPK